MKSNKEYDQFVPKGGMCSTCEHREEDCSSLPFGTMSIIHSYCDEKTDSKIAIVKCTSYERKGSNLCG